MASLTARCDFSNEVGVNDPAAMQAEMRRSNRQKAGDNWLISQAELTFDVALGWPDPQVALFIMQRYARLVSVW